MKILISAFLFTFLSFIVNADPACMNIAGKIDEILKSSEISKELRNEVVSKRDHGLMMMPTGKEACMKILNEGLDLLK